MSRLSKTFVKSVAEAMSDLSIQEMVGENFPKVDAVIKAAVGINDTSALVKIIMTLIPGLELAGLAAVRKAIDNPLTTVIVMNNTYSSEEEDKQ